MKLIPVLLLMALSHFGFAADSSSSLAQAPESSKNLKSPFKLEDSSVRAAGAKLFATNCSSCHGVEANGSGNVPALSRGEAQRAHPGELVWFINKGSPENGMPAFSLPEKERWQIASFIQSLPNNSAKKVATADTSAQKPELKSAQKSELEKLPSPTAPFTDFRFEKPGVIHKILPQDLPAPAPESSVGNGPRVVARPDGVWPQVPKGFSVQLFANKLDNPRLLRTAPNGDIFLAESSAGKILVFRGVTNEGQAKMTEVFANGLNEPYGISFYPSGPNPKWIYVGDTDAVMRFPYQPGDLHARGEATKIVDLPHGRGHWTRDLLFSADDKRLLVAVGSASNIDDPDTTPREKNRADILTMNLDGSDLKIYASGIRNAGGGMTLQPKTGALWCSVNERDALGDNLVPDYITHIVEGGFYGWPWWYIGAHQDPRHVGRHPELKEKVMVPDVLLQPHHASLQLAFYDGKMFPKEYQGDLFASQHGSWNRSVRTGYELIRVPFHGSDRAGGEYEDFMTGFVLENGNVWGRPVGVTITPDGAMLVSDDGSNSIWRVVATKK